MGRGRPGVLLVRGPCVFSGYLTQEGASPFAGKLDRETVNAQLRQAGLSPLHNIRRIIQLDEIPVLGTGKTDYRRLREILKDLALEESGQ